MTAAQAFQMGLVTRLVERGSLLAEVESMATHLATFAPFVPHFMKVMVQQGLKEARPQPSPWRNSLRVRYCKLRINKRASTLSCRNGRRNLKVGKPTLGAAQRQFDIDCDNGLQQHDPSAGARPH